MKKTLLITTGIAFILLLLSVWLYLLFFGTPDSVDEVFSDFSFGRDVPTEPAPTETTGDTRDTEPAPTESETVRQQLRQITTEPVAGFNFIQTTSGTTTQDTSVIYVESGTGHIYEYDVARNERNRISNITVPQTQTALISDDGKFVVTVARGGTRLFDLQSTSTTPEVTTLFTNPVNNVKIVDDYLLYTAPQDGQSVGVAHNLTHGTSETVFTFPIQSIRVSWGDSVHGDHIVYTQPADGLQSHVYKVRSAQRDRLPIAEYGLNLFHHQNTVFYSHNPNPSEPQQRVGMFYDIEEDRHIRLVTPVLKEKCTSLSNDALWCASDIQNTHSLSDWYKGIEQYSDSLWRVNPADGSATHQVSFRRESGREVDVNNIAEHAEVFMFRNKINGALWLYESN